MGMKMLEKLKLRLGAPDETVCVLPVFEAARLVGSAVG